MSTRTQPGDHGDSVAAYFRYSVTYHVRDWPWRPWRWKKVTVTRHA